MDTLLRTLALCCVAVAAVNGCSENQLSCNKRTTMWTGDGNCLDLLWVCNGVSDCADNSDESQCGSPRACPADYFPCRNGRCIPANWACDGTKNCYDDVDGGSDEHNCGPIRCGADEFACTSNRRDNGCIPRSWVCDGDHQDCVDDSDEQNCTSTPTPVTPENVNACLENQLSCKITTKWIGGGNCLDIMWVCNGLNDCADNSDESQCGSPRACPADYFPCRNGRCIPANWACDGKNNCYDDVAGGSDERNCDIVSCPADPNHCGADEFACQSNRRDNGCIPRSWVCDGDHQDCVDDSDEQNCGPNPNTTTSTLAPVTPGPVPNTTTSVPAPVSPGDGPNPNITTSTTAPVTPGPGPNTTTSAPAPVTPGTDKPAETDAVPQTPELGEVALLSRDNAVRLELPSWLATDQDTHFALSLAPMLRARAPRDKLDAQMAVLRLFRDLPRKSRN